MYLKALYFLRFISDIPLRLILFFSRVYLSIIRFCDYKNYSKKREEELQSYIDLSISRKINIGKKNFNFN